MSVELSVSLSMNGEAVPRSGKCYRGCHEIAGTGGSNSRAAEREGDTGLHLRYNSSMLSQTAFVYRESEILLISSLLLTFIFSAIVSCLKGNQRAVTLQVKGVNHSWSLTGFMTPTIIAVVIIY